MRHSCGAKELSHVFDTDDLIGTQIGRYRIDARIARGGMGVLYRAEHTGLGRTAALKVIAPELASDRDYRMRFEREAQAAAAIEHPNVVPVWDFAEDRGLLYIAMRYVDGPDLGEVIARSGRLAPQRAAAIVAQAAAGLDAAHARRLVHRDVKPGNLLIEHRPTGEHVWVTDFGLARGAASSRTGLTQHGTVLGTLDFIAPEQLNDVDIDGRVDVYALGCVLFYALSGRVPYPVAGDARKITAHLHEPIPPLPVPELGGRFDGIVARALAKSPDDRFQTAGQLGRAAWEAARGLSASRPQPTGPRTPTPRPHTPHPHTPHPRTPPPPQTPRPPTPAPRRRPVTALLRDVRTPSWLPVAAIGVVAALLVVGGLLATGVVGGEDPRATPTPDTGDRGRTPSIPLERADEVVGDFADAYESKDMAALLRTLTPDVDAAIDGSLEGRGHGDIESYVQKNFDDAEELDVTWNSERFEPPRGDEPARLLGRLDIFADGEPYVQSNATFELVRVGDDVLISRIEETVD